MNNFTEVVDTITRLIDSKKVSNYRIQKDTGVSYGAISELRNGKRKIKNLTLETVEKLYNYQKGLEVMDKSIKLENQDNITLIDSLSQYFTDIENDGNNHYSVDYALLNEVDHDGNAYYEVQINRTEEVPFSDEVTQDNIDALESKWLEVDQSGENYIESVFFENEQDAMDYITLVLKGNKNFADAAKAVGVIK